MKKSKTQKQPRRKFSSILLLLLLHSFSLHAADLLNSAALLEREGKSDEARDLYIQWLSSDDSSRSGRFGRILIHTLRMPGSLEEDLRLINTHLHRISSEQDRKDILETALILSELSGQEDLVSRYLPALEALGGEHWVPDITVARMTLGSHTKYEYMGALKENAGSPRLLQWIDRVHKQQPALIREPDWLYLLQDILLGAGYASQADIFRKRLLSDFPDSIEASILEQRVSLLPDPDDLIGGEGDPQRDTSPETDSFPAEEAPAPDSVTYQAGSFRAYENAVGLSRELQSAGLKARVIGEEQSFKVLVDTLEDSAALDVLRAMGIEAFRIHP